MSFKPEIHLVKFALLWTSRIITGDFYLEVYTLVVYSNLVKQYGPYM